MRRVTLLLAVMGVMVSLFAAAAYAATIEGTRQGEQLVESDRNDTIYGRGGADLIYAGEWGSDTDRAFGNAGNDRIDAFDRDGQDTVNGGNGTDICIGDPGDELINCETIEIVR
jgi:Ca2+-binding RTX toxin-like protein